MPIREIFAAEGESGFRARETSALEQIVKLDGFVVATGGGVIETPVNRELLKQGYTVFLDWSWAALAPWLKQVSRHSRPLLEQDDEDVRALFERRRPLYQAAAQRVEAIDEVVEDGLGDMLNRLCEGIHEALLVAERRALE